jgi:2'-5' RNA ligase
MRCFVALDLEDDFIKEISNIQNRIKKRNLFLGKFTESENLHLTLKFLGEIDDIKIEEVKKRLEEIKLWGFEASLGEIGVFSKSFPKIIWIKLNGAGIWDLQKQIDSKLKDLFEVEERFMSHITIARIKKVGDKKELLNYLKSIKPKKISFKVKEFSLKKSDLFPEGPRYGDLENYEFSSPPIFTN